MLPYHLTYRRSLLDMHIPDWDEKFLSEYEPEKLADEYVKSNVEAVLLYCKSHMGLSYWPTPVGGIHPAAKDRDLIGEMVEALKERNIRVAAYHSNVYDNWAAINHPEWRTQSPGTLAGEPNWTALGQRYGTLSVNNREYLEFEKTQISALLSSYEFDGLWVDMVFWPTIDVSEPSQKKCQEELGISIPTHVDWNNPDWNRFHEARVRWLEEFWVEIRDEARRIQPGIPIAHNFAATIGGWANASTTHQSSLDTFTGGDLYGGRDQQLVISKMMHSISAVQPAEYMTSRTPDLRYHVQLRSKRELLIQALGAMANHHAFLFIDAIDPVGTVQSGVYERMGSVFKEIEKYEGNLGGTPVQEVAIYFSDHSKMNWEENGTPITAGPNPFIPHHYNLFGASSALQEAHVPFGIITRSQLDKLSDFKVLVLPEVLRMDETEVEAIRDFVTSGGRVYASGLTGLGHVIDGRLDKNMMEDLVGATVADDYEAGVLFINPVDSDLVAAVAPEKYVSWGLTPSMNLAELAPVKKLDVRRLKLTGGRALGTLTLPYGYPHPGTLEGGGFASIHSSPPWIDTDEPAVVENKVGEGVVIYSVAPIEGSPDHASRKLFVELIQRLLGHESRLTVTAKDTVWVTAFDQLDRGTCLVSALNYDESELGSRVSAHIVAQPPVGYRFTTGEADSPTTTVKVSSDGSQAEITDNDLELLIQVKLGLDKL